jgi:hypothetical protein
LPLKSDELDEAENAVQARSNKYLHMLKNYGFIAFVDLAYKNSRDNDYPFFKRKAYSPIRSWREHGMSLLASSRRVFKSASSAIA